MRHIIGMTAVLAVIWLANSGIYTPMVLGLGLASLVFVLWLTQRLNLVDDESIPLNLSFSRRLPAFYVWLIWQMILSNIDLVKRIWRGNSAISPTVVDIPLIDSSDMSKVIFANSITLTPGTVVINWRADRIRVHAISRDVMDSLLEGEMARRVNRLEQ